MSIYVGTLYIDYNPKVALDTYIPYKAMCDAIFCKGNGLKIDIVLSYLPHVYGLFSLSVEWPKWSRPHLLIGQKVNTLSMVTNATPIVIFSAWVPFLIPLREAAHGSSGLTNRPAFKNYLGEMQTRVLQSLSRKWYHLWCTSVILQTWPVDGSRGWELRTTAIEGYALFRFLVWGLWPL